jgi:SAM-dependent methyltransferase
LAEHRFSRWLFRRLTFRHAVPPRYDEERFRSRYFGYDVDSTRRFFERFEGRVDVSGKTVLEVGCGRGAACAEAARLGAARVVGVDLEIGELPRKVLGEQPELARRVELLATDGSLAELGTQRFDVVLSKDSFEHYREPESFVFKLVERLAPEGSLAIGFGPLWKSPEGGHLEFMTRFPWAHLIFPEEVVLEERRRFRPAEDARSYEDVRGGLNRMTLARFLQIMESTGLERRFFRTNAGRNPIVRAMAVVSRLRPLREYLTMNVYGIWSNTPR